MNRRHKAAQMAQRASATLHTVLYFAHKHTQEKAYVMNVSAQRIDVIVPRFGVEGSVSMEDVVSMFGENSEQAQVVHDTDKHTLQIRGDSNELLLSVRVFDPVDVVITVQESDSGNKSLKIALANSVDRSGKVTANPAPQHAMAVVAEPAGLHEAKVEQEEEDDSASNKKKRKLQKSATSSPAPTSPQPTQPVQEQQQSKKRKSLRGSKN
jgi:hypothetical protein